MADDEEARRRGTIDRVRRSWRTLSPFARPHRRWLRAGLVAAVGVVLARLAFPWPLRGVMELVLPDAPAGQDSGLGGLVRGWESQAVWLGLAFLAIALVQGGAEYAQRVWFARFAIRLVHDARGAALQRLLGNPKRVRRARGRTGDVITRTVGDAARLKGGIKGGLVHASQNGVFVLGVGVILVLVDPLLGSVYLTGSATTFVVGAIGAVRISHVVRRHRRKESYLADTVHQVLAENNGMPVHVSKTNRSSGRADVQATRLEGITTWVVHGMLALTASTTALVGLSGVTAGRLSTGDLFLVLAYVLLAHGSMVRLVRHTARLGKILANAERLAKLVGSPDKVDEPAEEQPPLPVVR